MKTAKQLRQKQADYIRFGQVLLALSTILMIGLLLPDEQKEALQLYVMMVTIVGFLGAAFFFFKQGKKLQQQAEELEYEKAS